MKLKQIIVYQKHLNYVPNVPAWRVSCLLEDEKGIEQESEASYFTREEALYDAKVIQRHFGGELEVM